MDLITSLPQVSNYDVIVVYIDHFSKQTHVIPTTSNVDADGIADIHYCEIIQLHGISTKIVLDCGPQFAAQLMQALYHCLRITHTLTTVYHPQSNGQTECVNWEVKQHLQLFTNSCQDDWVKYLPTAKFVLNSHLHLAHQKTPFKLIYRYKPDFTVPAGPPTKFLALDQ